MHTEYTSLQSSHSSLLAEKQNLTDEIATLKNDHSVIYEKFQQEFDKQKSYTLSLVKKASDSEESRKKSDKFNAAKVSELEKFAKEAGHTVTKISAEWKTKLKLIREAEGAVVRNAQLEIENSQLNRDKLALQEELRKVSSLSICLQASRSSLNCHR